MTRQQRQYVRRMLYTATALPCNIVIEDHEPEARGRWLIVNLAELTTTVVQTKPEPPQETKSEA